MKVFLSWSGAQSHNVALVFREWLPSVIQAVTPYVSSEDIDKGARWSTDIAKELSDSTFGILCVTRDNINAPWLNFEAGALSKTIEKSFVIPFLFDVKRAEVNGPILQFQSTVREKGDIKKLIETLNSACEKDQLLPDRLQRAFEVWYPSLEDGLNRISTDSTSADEDHDNGLLSANTQSILEEILDISRINQKIIRSPEITGGGMLEEINNRLRDILSRIDRQEDGVSYRRSGKFHPMMIEELLHFSHPGRDGFMGVRIALSLVRNQLPWIYDVGIEVISILRSDASVDEKRQSIDEFKMLLEFSTEHPIMRDALGRYGKEYRIFYHELPRMLSVAMQETISSTQD